MKFTSIILILTCLNNPVFPEGVWIYKQDSSRMEISETNGKLTGILVSTKNPECKSGTLLLKDFDYCEGYWHGKFFMSSKQRWVEARFLNKKYLLLMELDLWYTIKKTQWFKERI